MWWSYVLFAFVFTFLGILIAALLHGTQKEEYITERDYIWNVLGNHEVPDSDFSGFGYYIGWDQSVIEQLARVQMCGLDHIKYSKNWILVHSYLDELNYLGQWIGSKEWDDVLLEYARLRNEDFWHFDPHWIPTGKSKVVKEVDTDIHI